MKKPSLKTALCILALFLFFANAEDIEQINTPETGTIDPPESSEFNSREELTDEEKDEKMEEEFQKAQEQVKLNDELKQDWEIKKEKKPKDPRTLNEKARAKLHLPKTRKIYYHNLDLSKQPKFNTDYLELAKDIKREDFKIPEPVYEKKPKFVIPDPHYRVVFYNSPAGGRKIELKNLYINHKMESQAILSPDIKRLVYTSVFYYPTHFQTGYEAHYINIKDGTKIPDALKNTYITQQEMKPIVTSIFDKLDEYKLATLFPLDWSKDGSKIAFKEQIGSTLDGIWETNVIVYDFNTGTSRRLNTLREAIIYYWYQNFGIDLTNYMWDLYPLGWSAEEGDRIVFYAYAFSSKSKPYFLGTWSIDFEETKSKLISIDQTSVPISLNGYGLRLIELSH